MNRPIVKYVVRIALFASTVAALACSNTTGPNPVNAKSPALKDSTLNCRSGFTVIDGRMVCNDGM
jgi:hypothetical protein